MDPGSRFFFNFCDFCFSWTMDHALSNLENFECQGHNSLNFDPIFKILCLNISSFQDLSFSFTEHPRGKCPHGTKCVLKWVHEKQKSQKL